MESSSNTIIDDNIDNHILPLESNLYQTLECGADGKPGGILITSVSQQVIPHIWLGGYKALETVEFLEKNKITCILTLGHFKPRYSPGRFLHKVKEKQDNTNDKSLTYIYVRLFLSQIIPKPILFIIFQKPRNSLIRRLRLIIIY